MVIYRPTRKLINKGIIIDPEYYDSTTTLGDWYIDLIIHRPFNIALFTSEKSLLPVLLQASPIGTLIGRFPKELEKLLLMIGIDNQKIAEEKSRMIEYLENKTRSRKVIGIMTEYKLGLEDYQSPIKRESLLDISINFAGMLYGAPEYKKPIEETRILFNAAQPAR
jgi:hypothetical protein